MMRKVYSYIVVIAVILNLFFVCGCSENDKLTSVSGNGSQTNSNSPNSIGWEEDGVLKILMIGNSFSVDTMEYVYQIATSAGIEKLHLATLWRGGCTLEYHTIHAKNDMYVYDYQINKSNKWYAVQDYLMSDAIRSQNWDYISIQQASGDSGIESTYSEDLEYLIGYIKQLCPNAKLIWNMTWAYQQDCTYDPFLKYDRDQMKMYNSIVTTVEKMIKPRDDIYTIIPIGTTIQNARTSYIGDTLTRDGFHLSYEYGRYLAGLTFFCKLTGIPAENVTFAPDGIDEQKKKVAIESVTNAINHPFMITDSQYKSRQ